MTTESDEQAHAAIERTARAAFAESVADLDGATLSRLNRARQSALAAAGAGRAARRPWGLWVPAGALAATALLALVLLRAPGGPVPATPLAAEADADLQQGPLAIVAAGEDLELATEADLDFYAWVDVETAGEGNT